MTKTLLVKYIPRGDNSRTKQLVDVFLENVKGDVEVLDMLQDTPDFLDEKRLEAYTSRGYGGKELNEEQAKSMESMDRMTKQVVDADNIVLAYPMHNFSVPAMVKAWFDAITQKGKTWDMNETGFIGLLKGNALVLSTSGGVYTGTPMEKFNHSTTLAKEILEFMGLKTEVVFAEGMDALPKEEKNKVMENSKQKIKEITNQWYE